MLVGLMSDTHDNRDRTQRALKLFEEHAPQALLHAGDLHSGVLVPLFERRWTWLAQGNTDRVESIRQAISEHDVDIMYGETHEIQIAEKRIGLIHGHDAGRLEGMINGGAFDLVVHGHTHSFRDETIGDTRVVNPGAVHRASPPTVCLYDVATDELTRLEIDP